jgi:transposase
VERGEKRLVVHADNAKRHTAKVTREFCDDDDNFLRIARHPPYSLDLAPSDLFLFGYLKAASKDSNSGL